MSPHVPTLTRTTAFLVVGVILLWSLLLTLCFDLALSSPTPARRFPLRSWSPNQTNESIRFKDFTLNFRLLEFPETLTADCQAGNLTLLVIVQSAPDSGLIRDVIRRTWASEGLRSLQDGSARVVFLIGNGLKASERLRKEIETHRDIILTDADDQYKNLVYKSAISLFISHTHCPTPFLLKADQDVVFNIDRFLQQIGSPFHADHSAVYCRVRYFSVPYRNVTSRWYISERQFSGWYYPPYCIGPAYVLTSQAVETLLGALPNFEIIRIEDVFLTGIVSSAVGVRRFGMKSIFQTEYTTDEPFTDCPGQILAVHNLKKVEDIENTWRFLVKDC